MNKVTILLVAIGLASCGPKAGIHVTRVIHASPLPANCALELVQVDRTSMAFNSTWEVLGYITFQDKGSQDPMAEENRALARPKACKLGGTSIAVAMSSTSTNQIGQSGSGIIYMVLRPKSAAPPPPTAF